MLEKLNAIAIPSEVADVVEQPRTLDAVLSDPKLSGVQMTLYEYEQIHDYILHHEESWTNEELERFTQVQDFLSKKINVLQEAIQKMSPHMTTTRQTGKYIQLLEDAKSIVSLLQQEQIISDNSVQEMLESRNLSQLIDLYNALQERHWLSQTESIESKLAKIEEYVQGNFSDTDFDQILPPEHSYTIGESKDPEPLSLSEIRRCIQPSDNPQHLADMKFIKRILEGDPATLSQTPSSEVEDIRTGHEFEGKVTKELLEIPEVVCVLNLPSHSIGDHEKVDHIVFTLAPAYQKHFDPSRVFSAVISLKNYLRKLDMKFQGKIGDYDFQVCEEVKMLGSNMPQAERIDQSQLEEIFEIHFVQAKNSFGSGSKHYDEHNMNSKARQVLYINGLSRSGEAFDPRHAKREIQKGLGLGLFAIKTNESE